MFTRNDFISFLSDLETTENRMLEIYKNCSEKIDDPELEKMFTALYKAEVIHEGKVNSLKDCFSLPEKG